jgi:hypothetical protein
MNRTRHIVIPLAIFAATAAAGWLLRRPSTEAKAPEAATETNSKASKRERKLRDKEVPAEVLARLAPLRNARTTEERLRATIQLAQTLPVADIEAWYDAEWFDGEEDMQSYLFHRITRARWLAEDPAGLMARCLRKETTYTSEVAAAWAERDPAAAFAFLDGVDKPEQQGKLISGMGAALAKSDPQLVLARIAEIHSALGSKYSGYMSAMLAGLADAAPDLLKERLDEMPPALRERARQSLAKAGLKTNFTGTLDELSQTTGGKAVFAQAVQHDEKLMAEAARNLEHLPPGWFGEIVNHGSYYLVRSDPEKWLDSDLEGMGLDARQAAQVRGAAISQLASKDPDRVMKMLADGDWDETQRANAIYSLAGQTDKDKMETWLASLTDPNDIAAAKDAMRSRSGNPDGKEVTPSSLLADLAGGTSLNWAQSRAMGRWGEEKVAAFGKEFESLPAEQKPDIAKKFIESHYDNVPSELRGQLIAYLLENPEPEPAGNVPRQQRNNPLVQAASQLAAEWADRDPAAAGRWVSTLPAGEDRLWAAKNLAARWAEYEPAATRRWIATLPGDEREAVQQYLDSGEATAH